MMSFESLSEAIQRRYPQRPLVAAQIAARAQQAIGEKAEVVSYYDGTLKLKVEDNFRASQLRLDSARLIGEINQALSRELVERIVFRLG